MEGNKMTTNDQVRQEYEPVEVKVMEITSKGVLCASGGVYGGLQSYSGSKF